MTLQELWMIIARRWKLVGAVVLVCVLACGGWLFLAKSGGASYTATAYIVGNSQVTGVSGLATAEARDLPADLAKSGVSVSAKSETNSMTVAVTAEGADAQACVDAANCVAEAANEAAEEAYADWDTPYNGTVNLATSAAASGSGGKLKYLLVAFLAGLFVAICIVVVLDMLKRPVKTPEGVQEAVELPVLEIMPAKSGERLLANVRFAASAVDAAGAADAGRGTPLKDVASVLVVPSGDADAAKAACDAMRSAADSEGATSLKVAVAQPLAEGMAGAYAAREADAVVVTARQWADALPQLESTVAELRLAGANLAGIVFAKEK